MPALMVLAAGCAQSPQAVNLQGYPPAFRQGYSDGCASAPALARRVRDDERFKSDANYAQGWADGYAICGKKR